MACKLKEYRLKKGLTQKKLSETADVPMETIRGLERGTANTTDTATLIRLADALGIAAEDLFFAENVKHIKRSGDQETEWTASGLQREIDGYFASISRMAAVTEEVPTEERDSRGHVVYETVPVKNDRGETIRYREFALPPTVGGLCTYLGITRGEWELLCRDTALKSVTDRAVEVMQTWNEEQLLFKKDVRGLIFHLQNNYGYRQKVEVDNGAKAAGTGTLSLEEKLELVRKLRRPCGEEDVETQ